ncbi:MAG TPA: ROK family protein [Gemmatimonadaceae bacterium]|nr:ROK family protein [Gemmatimonadaceae bacterium]
MIGVDLGGTNVVTGAVSPDGTRTLGVHTASTQVDAGADGVVDRIVAQIEATIADAMREAGVSRDAFLGVGIGAPGPLDRANGVVVVAPNLGWHNFPLRQRIAERVKLPATLDNDANCATVGEWWQGAARGARHVVGLTIGTGIGGGLIVDGRLLHGASDVAGEVGHSTIELNGRYCKCGNYGCLEAYASGPAIATRAREVLMRDGAESCMPGLVDGDLARLTAATVYAAARSGDAVANEIVRETGRYLGAGVANLLNVFNPDVVVVAGGVTAAGEHLFGPLNAEVRRRAFAPAVAAARVVPGSLPGTAGVVGAAWTFLDATTPGGTAETA